MDEPLPPSPAPPNDPPQRPRAALLALPPAVFLLHFAAVYAFTGMACALGWHARHLGPFALLPAVVVGLTVVAAGGLLLAMPRAQPPPRHPDTAPRDDVFARARFLSTTTRMTTALSLAGMVAVALPSLLTPGCG